MQIAQFEECAHVEQQHWWFQARIKILQSLLGCILPPNASTNIVDIGCGTGFVAAALAPLYNVTGIDPAVEAIAIAQSRHPGMRFLCGNAADHPDCLRSAHAVLLLDVLEHIQDDVGTIRTIVQCMQSGAYLLIMVPAHIDLWSPHDTASGHFRRYEAAELQKLFSDLPVHIDFLSQYQSRLYPIIRMMKRMSALRKKSWGDAGLDFFVPPSLINVALGKLFASEARPLSHALRTTHNAPFSRGISYVAVVRKI